MLVACYPSRKPHRHPEGGTTEARPNVPFGTGGDLLSSNLPLRQKWVRSIKVGDFSVVPPSK
jgi:hypothetical protein